MNPEEIRSFILEFQQISEPDIQEYLDNEIELYEVDTSRFSFLLKSMLTAGEKHSAFTPAIVGNLISDLEMNAPQKGIKPPGEFKHPPLQGFWKAHFFDPQFMLKNIMNHWNKRQWNALLKDQFPEGISNTPNWPAKLADALVHQALDTRSAQDHITGEWLIFKPWQGKNYYLTLAQHTSGTEGDTRLYDNMRRFCEWEFPFLF